MRQEGCLFILDIILPNGEKISPETVLSEA